MDTKTKNPVAIVRRFAGMPGRNFALLVGITHARLVAIEAGKLKLPRGTALRIAAIFGVDLDSLSGNGSKMAAWDGTPLTASKIRDYTNWPHDEQQFKKSWAHPMKLQLFALLDAAAGDRQKSRILLAELTSWMEGIRQSLGLVDETEMALAAAGAPGVKRHFTTNVGALRAYFGGQVAAEEFPHQRLGDQWRQIDRSTWEDSTPATAVEDITPLWSPLLDPSRPARDTPPVNGPVWKFSWDLQIFVDNIFAGTISSFHTLATADPLAGGLGWVEPVPPTPNPLKRKPKPRVRRVGGDKSPPDETIDAVWVE